MSTDTDFEGIICSTDMTTTTVGAPSSYRPLRETQYYSIRVLIYIGQLDVCSPFTFFFWTVGSRMKKVSVVSTDSDFEHVINNTDMTTISTNQDPGKEITEL